MSSYPHDEFDDVPEDSERRGAYRGEVYEAPAARAGFYGILITGCVGLLIGALMFIFQPRTLAPSASSSASASASASATATAKQTKQPSELSLEIYNGGAYAGAAAEVQAQLTEAGYTVTATENWTGTPLSTSMVYYASGNVDEANALADKLGIEYITADPSAKSDLYIVLGPDYTGSASTTTDGSDSSSDDSSESSDSSSQTAEQESEDTASADAGSFVAPNTQVVPAVPGDPNQQVADPNAQPVAPGADSGANG